MYPKNRPSSAEYSRLTLSPGLVIEYLIPETSPVPILPVLYLARALSVKSNSSRFLGPDGICQQPTGTCKQVPSAIFIKDPQLFYNGKYFMKFLAQFERTALAFQATD
ncbi:hypothetical protein PSTG_17352 [Puccinia striiformis f. sp. tritici PST-78]|uniref:Uncharacterized protein n=1 Tax=Puccinia striiformis f. sp. tritici PST-78 TaxID=1165861 RepID=A0A0L0UQD5_9BASI|nr:hypothetical protein PSTG_17352 [Puccinia striiformis f. sp. tritici PST-78]